MLFKYIPYRINKNKNFNNACIRGICIYKYTLHTSTTYNIQVELISQACTCIKKIIITKREKKKLERMLL